MIEAAYLQPTDDGTSEIWAKCTSCHKSTLLLTNRRPGPEGQPFCMCEHCGETLYSDRLCEAFVEVVVVKGWGSALRWIIEQRPEEE